MRAAPPPREHRTGGASASIDPRFAETLARAREAGVRNLGRRCRVTLEGITLGKAIPARVG